MSRRRTRPRRRGLVLPSLLASFLGVGLLPDAATAAQESSRLAIEPEEVDFGQVEAGKVLERVIVLRNQGAEPLTLKRIGVNCGCADLNLRVGTREVPFDRKNDGRVECTLGAGQQAELRLRLDTSNWPAGPSRKRCLVFHDGGGGPRSIWFGFDVLGRDGEVVPEPEPDGPSRLRADPMVHELGPVLVGEVIERTFRLRNTSERPLLLQSLRGQCSCMRYRLLLSDGEVLAHDRIAVLDEAREIHRFGPGEEAELQVSLETADLVDTPVGQPMTKSVRLFTDDPDRPFVQLDLHGDLESAVRIEPAAVRFGPVLRGAEHVAEVWIHPGPLKDFSLGGVVSDRPESVSARIERQEGEDAGWRVTVLLDPRTPVGRVQALLRVRVEHPRVEQLVIPVDAQVRPAVEFGSLEAPGVERLDFGRTPIGEDAERGLRILNLDPAQPYLLRSVRVESRQGAEHFEARIVERRPGEEYEVRVRVLASMPTRFFSGHLVLVAEHPDVPEYAVPLRGWKQDRP